MVKILGQKKCFVSPNPTDPPLNPPTDPPKQTAYLPTLFAYKQKKIKYLFNLPTYPKCGVFNKENITTLPNCHD